MKKIVLVMIAILFGSLLVGCKLEVRFQADRGNDAAEHDSAQNIRKEQKELFGTSPLAEYIPGYVDQVTASSSSFQCTLNNGRWASGSFQAWEGQSIAIALFCEQEVSLRVGILDPNGWLHYVSGSGDIAHTFQVEQSGVHHLVIYGQTTEPMEVMGIYLTRGETGGQQMDIKDLDLFSYKNGEWGSEITAVDAREILEEVRGKLEEGTLMGMIYEGNIPTEEEQETYRFGHYLTVQDLGDACSVTLHGISAYDGTTERLLVAWLEDTPKAWKEYQLLDFQFGDDAFREGQWFIVTHRYTLGFQAPQDEETVKHLTQFGFSHLDEYHRSYIVDKYSYEADYTYHGRFDCIILCSVFEQ